MVWRKHGHVIVRKRARQTAKLDIIKIAPPSVHARLKMNVLTGTTSPPRQYTQKNSPPPRSVHTIFSYWFSMEFVLAFLKIAPPVGTRSSTFENYQLLLYSTASWRLAADSGRWAAPNNDYQSWAFPTISWYIIHSQLQSKPLGFLLIYVGVLSCKTGLPYSSREDLDQEIFGG